MSAANRTRREERYKRQRRQRETQFQLEAWLKRFDVNRSGALEREEVSALLTHLHPQNPPDSKALDLLIERATEVRTYSMHISGDRNGKVYPEKVMKVVSTYAAYVLAAAAFDRLDSGTGVLQLKDLPALVSEARAAQQSARDNCGESEVSFILAQSIAPTNEGDAEA